MGLAAVNSRVRGQGEVHRVRRSSGLVLGLAATAAVIMRCPVVASVCRTVGGVVGFLAMFMTMERVLSARAFGVLVLGSAARTAPM